MENKKVYVVTHCAAEQNYTPRVFASKNDALDEVKKLYNDLIRDNEDYIDSDEFWKSGFEIIWSDDTYNRVDTFEVEVEA